MFCRDAFCHTTSLAIMQRLLQSIPMCLSALPLDFAAEDLAKYTPEEGLQKW